MSLEGRIKLQSYIEFWQHLPYDERIIVDVLRVIILKTLPSSSKERLTYNVPFYYGNKRICFIWPSTIPKGGIKSGVLFGFCYGNKLIDVDAYLTHGTNKQVFYKIYHSIEDINEKAIVKLLNQAIEFDSNFR